MKTPILAILVMVLAGCASVDQQRIDIYQSHVRAHQAAMIGALETCKTDDAALTVLCTALVSRELAQASPRIPARDYHPAWGIADRVLSAAVPLAGSYLIGGQWRRALRDTSAGFVDFAGHMAGMDTADYSTHITAGGHIGDGWQDGDNDHSRHDYSRRGGRHDSDGDDYNAGGDIRITSPGPIDESGDCRDGGNCSVPEPPAP